MPVRPSVRPLRVSNWNTRRKNKIGVFVLELDAPAGQTDKQTA